MKRMFSRMQYIKSMKPHFHEDELEVILVLKGKIDVYKVERHICLNEGEFTFINRRIVHYLLSEEGAYVLSTKIRLSEFKDIFNRIEYVEFLNNDELMELERPLKNRLNAIVADSLIRDYQYQGLQHLQEEKVFNENQLVYMLFSSYQLISHMKKEEEYPGEELQNRYYFIVEYITKHMDKKIVADDILKHIYMNPTYFSQFMKKVGGVGFKEFVLYRKLIAMLCLLINDDMSMVDIASAVGIFDMKSFYNIFKKHFHLSPAKWKEQVLTIEDDYSLCHQRKIIEEFTLKYHIHKHRENTIAKLYKYLISCQLHQILWNETEIVLNPYQDMGEYVDDDYQVYKYFGALIHYLKRMDAHLVLLYPFKYLQLDIHRELLLETLQVNILQNGLSEIKKWKIVFEVSKIENIQEAIELKGKIIERFGLNNIHISLNI